MEQLEERVRRLERTFTGVSAAVGVLSIAVLVYLGISGWHLIPDRVDEVVSDAARLEVEEVLPDKVAHEIANKLTQEVSKQLAAIVPDAVRQYVENTRPEFDNQLDGYMATVTQRVLTSKTLVDDLEAIGSAYEKKVAASLITLNQPLIFDLGEIVCGKEYPVDVPVPGTTTSDWILIGVNPMVSADIEKRKSGDNAIFRFSTDIRSSEDGRAWQVDFKVHVNYNTTSDNNKIWQCDQTASGFQSIHRDERSRLRLIAIRSAMTSQ